MSASETHPDDDQTPPDFDEYGEVPNSGETTDVDEREDLDESPLG